MEGGELYGPDDGRAGRTPPRHRENAVLQGRALEHDCRYLRAARVGREPRLRGMAPARAGGSATLAAGARLLRGRDRPGELTMARVRPDGKCQASANADVRI